MVDAIITGAITIQAAIIITGDTTTADIITRVVTTTGVAISTTADIVVIMGLIIISNKPRLGPWRRRVFGRPRPPASSP